jgi:hypothetical protein
MFKPRLTPFALGVLFLPVASFAATGGEPETASLTPIILAASAAAVAVLRYIVKREVANLAQAIGSQLSPSHAASLDAAIDQAASSIVPVLASVADDLVKTRLSGALASAEAQAIIRYLPQATAALGLTPDVIASRITAALGDPLVPPSKIEAKE